MNPCDLECATIFCAVADKDRAIKNAQKIADDYGSYIEIGSKIFDGEIMIAVAVPSNKVSEASTLLKRAKAQNWPIPDASKIAQAPPQRAVA